MEGFLPAVTAASSAAEAGATSGSGNTSGASGQHVKMGALILGAAGVFAGAMMV